MQHIAREGRCWVISCGVALERKDLPEDFPHINQLYPDGDDGWINPGDSIVVSPEGKIVAGPLSKQKGHILIDIDVDVAGSSKRTLDVAGHYSRPDVFTLEVNRSRPPSAYFKNEK